jgi:glycosyltransferase involved in cell wall biosynthesis
MTSSQRAASVVIPTFNRARMVVNAVESALQQTCPPLEIIVVDDGSTDDTAERLGPYRDRIQYVYQPNRGASAAQNAGITYARAPWIAILASDDMWLPTKLQEQFEALEELGPEFGACFTDCVYVGESLSAVSNFRRGGLNCEADHRPLDEPLTYVLGRNPALFVQSMLISRDVLDRVGHFDERLVVGEDTDLILRLALRTRICVVRAVLVRIDRSPSNARLSSLFLRPDDRLFACVEHRYEKWLSLPEVVADRGLRARLGADLRDLYYTWAVARLYDLRMSIAITAIRKLRKHGVSSVEIVGALALRAARKMVSHTRVRRRSRS